MFIIEKLRNQSTMTTSEIEISNFLLEHGRDLKRYSTRDLADVTYTSPATVIRLCKKLGFAGFNEFRERFLEELRYFEQQVDEIDANFPFSKEDSAMRAANRIAQLHSQTIEDTMSLLHYRDLQKAARLLARCRRVHVFSFGTSLNQAESFREKMLKIGKQVSISSNLNYQLYEARCLTPHDLAIAISYSGETEKILLVAQACKDHRCPLIAITSYGDNSLSAYADCKLKLPSKERLFENAADYCTHVSVNLLLDILYSTVFLRDFDSNYQRKLDAAHHLEKKRWSNSPQIMPSSSSADRPPFTDNIRRPS